MTVHDTPFLILAVLAYAKALQLQALEFQRPSVSAFELRRRAAADDPDARAALEQEKWLPKVEALRRAFIGLLWVVAAGSAAVCGFTVWLIVAGLLLASPLIARYKPLRRLAVRFFAKLKPHVLQVSDVLWPFIAFWAPAAKSANTVVNSAEELLHVVTTAKGVTEEQKSLLENRLRLHTEAVGQYMVPLSKIARIADDEVLGPKTLDTLHRTGQSVFAVMHGSDLMGLLYAEKIMNIAAAGLTAAKAMDRSMYYVHESQPVESIGQLAVTTGAHFFVVVNDSAEVVGGISLEAVLKAAFTEGKYQKYEDPRLAATAKRG